MDGFLKEKPAPRITVMDSIEMEKEVYRFLRQAILVDKFIPAMCLNHYEAELDAILKFIIWKFSVSKRNATFGQQLQRLKYSSDSSQSNLRLLGILNIGGCYLKDKISNGLTLFNQIFNSQIFNTYIKLLKTSFYILNFITFIKFIREGDSPTFLEFILKLKPISTVSLSSRIIRHSTLTREFLWHSCIETVLLLIPLINYCRWRRRLEKLFTRKEPRITDTSVYSTLTNIKCVSCSESAILPYRMSCGHLFCYYCFQSNLMSDPKYDCPRCGFSNTSTAKPLSFKTVF